MWHILVAKKILNKRLGINCFIADYSSYAHTLGTKSNGQLSSSTKTIFIDQTDTEKLKLEI